jgi:hypothetical protein
MIRANGTDELLGIIGNRAVAGSTRILAVSTPLPLFSFFSNSLGWSLCRYNIIG